MGRNKKKNRQKQAVVEVEVQEPEPIPRPRSRMSSYSDEREFERLPSVTFSQEDLGRSTSHHSLTGMEEPASRSSSRSLFRVLSSSSGLKFPPVARATSTPIGSLSGHQSLLSMKENYSQSEMNNNNNISSRDLRTYHAGSEYLENRLSKLSIHSNNDEFVLIGGHPPMSSSSDRLSDRLNPRDRSNEELIPRARSRMSSYHQNEELIPRTRSRTSSDRLSRESVPRDRSGMSSEELIPRASSKMSNYRQSAENVQKSSFERIPSIAHSLEDLGRSISQQSLTGIDNGHISRSSSRYSMGTNSNTDDRLMLAARYRQSPEAEGLTGHNQSGGGILPSMSRRSSLSRSSASDRGVGFVEIPTLYSHPDEKFDDDEPGEPYRPTVEHNFTPTSTSTTRQSLRRSDAMQNDGGFSSSSSSLSKSDENQPQKALIVTSALTPVIPKRNGAMSLSHSEESLVMIKTPQTVQRVSEQKHMRPSVQAKKMVETAVQTGNSIRLRQNQHFGDVLSECAYLPEQRGFGMSPTTTTSFVPGEQVFIPKADDPSAPSAPSNSFRNRLRHISDIYSTDGGSGYNSNNCRRLSSSGSSAFVEIPKPVEPTIKPSHRSTEEIVVPITISKPTTKVSSKPIQVEITKSKEAVNNDQWNKEKNGDTIRNHIPRGRIRDLASAFDKMTGDSPVRPLQFKSQVHIPSAKEENFWNMKKTSGEAEAKSITDIHIGSSTAKLSGPGSSSSAFRSSTQTIRSQEERRRSTSSSLHHQPHVFTRNTFLTSSVVKPGDKSNLPTNVAMNTNYSRNQDNFAKGDGFVSAFEKIPLQTSSTHLHSDDSRYTSSPRSNKQNSSRTHSNKNLERSSPAKETMFSEYSRKTTDVPVRLEVSIGGRSEKMKKQQRLANTRAKTQEIPSGTFEFESRYESRAVSGDLNDESNVFGMQKPLFAASREAFGKDTAEDLRGGKQENWPRQHQWSSEFQMNESNHHNPLVSPNYVSSTQYEINHNKLEPRRADVPSTGRQQSMTMPRHPYSPPATEDAGSRITHHTSQTLQSEDLFATTEDSSIRGKIDRMFDFVESDDSRKTLKATHHESHASTDTIGTNGINQSNKYRWNESSRLGGGANKAAEIPQALKQRAEPKLKSPERRNTVTVPELEFIDNGGLEYSLSQYREMQREQLRRRLPSADEPQFFRSPMLSAPHAGQSLHAYRAKDLMGTPTAGEKFRFPSSSSGLRLPPAALATSTPVNSPPGRLQSSFFSTKENYSSQMEINNNTNMIPPNDTFVSSISGVSAVDKHADVMRKINRLSYMIENTQKQMSMNEAALLDAVKKGRRSQEIAAHRSILISRETLRLQRTELRRLHALSAVRRPPPPMAKELRGSVIFKNLIVHLNKLFVSRLTIKDDNSYSFVGLFKFGHQVEATELVPLRVYPGEETCDKLFFVKQIQFSDVPVDFMVTIEIYAMRVAPAKPVELSIGSSLASKCKSLMGPPQKKSNVALETAFKFRGRLILDRDAAGERCLYLDDVTYPLEGTVMITTQCSRLPEAFEVDFRGFLTMFHTISNMASWERYWAILRRGVVLFWQYPDDEQMGREPKMQIDLTKCTNNSIEKCGFDLCPRANSFVVEILVDSEDGTIGSVVEKKRVLLSADSSEMLAQWLFTLNQTLDVIRGPI